MARPWVEQVTAINLRYTREVRVARQFPHLHTYRQELISQARDHRATAMHALGIRDDRRTGLVGV